MTHFLLLLVALTLGGCAYDWVKVSEPVSNISWQVTDLATIRTIPGCEAAIACAIPFPSRNICVVLATTKLDDTPASIIEHEKKHCAGYAHK